ncbi:MAG: hypothetical protein SFY68_14975 [Candidatus Sumerlaeia bacterium]|nr:hypothetical protein [Candidatus Sumerlaeia bacterium]
MPIDLDEIRKGRRREWDALRDPEERREELREEREKEIQARGQKSWMRRRDEERAEQSSQDEADWKRSKRRVLLLSAAFVFLILSSYGWNYAVYRYQESARATQLKQLTSLMNSDILYSNQSTPLDTWASWRSGYLKQNPDVLHKVFSSDQLKRMGGTAMPAEWKRKLGDKFKKGTEERNILLAREFENPTILYYPKWGKRDGALCVLKDVVLFPKEYGGNAVEYVVVIVWESKTKSWKVEEIRTADTWRENWTHKNHISKTRNSDQLRREERAVQSQFEQ